MKFMLLAIAILVSSPALALDAASFKFEAPVLSPGKRQVSLEVPAAGISQIRILLAKFDGYRVVPMEPSDGMFKADLSLANDDRAEFQFQVRPTSGTVFETGFYHFKNAGAVVSDKEIDAEKIKYESMQAQKLRAEQNLNAVKNTNPELLAKGKNQELARALLLLSKRERELAEMSKEGAANE